MPHCDKTRSGWPLERRLYWIRVLQCSIAVVNFITSTFLLGYISSHTTQSIQGGLTVTCIVAGLTFITTLLGNWFGWHLSGYFKRGCLSLFIIFDLCCIGLQIPQIIVLAVAGLPWNCGGLTTVINPGEPSSGFRTSGFGSNGEEGALDRYCDMPKSSFWLSIILMALYVYSIGLSIRQMIIMGRKARERKSSTDPGPIAQPQTPQPAEFQQWFDNEQPTDRAVPVHNTGDNHGNLMAKEAYVDASSIESQDPPPYRSVGRKSLDKGRMDRKKH